MAKRYALVIGISEYNNLRSLDNVVRDAEAIANKLAASGFEVERYPSRWIEAEERYEITTTSVTKDKLLQKIGTFLFKTAENSEAIIYLAGHGLRVESPYIDPKGYLAVSNSQGNGNGDLLFADLNNLFAKARNEAHLSSLVVLLDCCHAGMALEETVERKMFDSEFSAFREQSKFGILAACRGHQEAYEKGEHGLFTSAVLEGLEPSNARKDSGVISFDRLADFVQMKLQGKGQESVELSLHGASIEIVNYAQNLIPENGSKSGNKHELNEILLELNYNQEDSVFAHFLEEDLSVGFFLINSDREGGQRWLINRFWQKKVPISTDAIKKYVVIKKQLKNTTLWEKISVALEVEQCSEKVEQCPEKIYHKIYHKLYEHWNNQTT
ncbi:MAG: caspase family protein, partial [Xenococcaceae cyanobacterium MO_234.B1]|nr:caspase family protein [Xenococcaceae cyanobacterium MO_234.B1]